MILTDDEITIMANVGRHNRTFVELVDRLRQAELEMLAVSGPDNFSTRKGRVQMLTELLQQFRL